MIEGRQMYLISGGFSRAAVWGKWGLNPRGPCTNDAKSHIQTVAVPEAF
jgi:hypothetical protein